MTRVWDDADPVWLTDELVGIVGEALEDAALQFLGRDLGTIHRDNIAHAALTAAADAVEGAIRAEALAPVAALADEIQSLHDRVCKDTEEAIPLAKRHAHNCGVTSVGVARDLRAVLGDPDAIAKHNAAIAAKAVAPVLAVLDSAKRGLALDMGSVSDHTVKVGHLRAALCTCGAIEYGAMAQHLIPCPLARTTEGTSHE